MLLFIKKKKGAHNAEYNWNIIITELKIKSISWKVTLPFQYSVLKKLVFRFEHFFSEFFYHKSRLVLIELTTSFLVEEGARKTLGAKLGKNLRPTWHLKLCLSHSLRLQLLKEGCPIHTNGVWSSNYYQSWAIVLDVRVWFLGKRVVSTVCNCKLSSFLCHVASSMRWSHPVKGNLVMKMKMLIMWKIFYCFVLHQGHHVILILGFFLVCNQE